MDAKQILRSDLDDIIFENRNKAYGAYDIRKKYRDRVSLSMLIAVSFVVLVLLYPEIEKLFSKATIVDKDVVVVTKVNKLKAPPPLENPPPPPKIPPPKPPEKLVFTKPKVVKEKVMDTIADIKKIEKTPETNNNDKGTGPVAFDPPAQEQKVVKQPEPDKIYEAVDEQPEPPGGQEGYNKFLSEHIKFPAQAIDAGVQGTVYISLTVGKDGQVTDVKVKKDPVGYGCGDEAVRVISSMPPWKPGRMNHQAVSVRFVIPVKFVVH